MEWLLLLVGLVILLAGGEALVRGATALSRSFGVSSLVIGLTVLAFGTSAPELAVTVAAALRGNGAITFGNIVGSNIGNIGLIVGLTAVVRPLAVRRTIVTREIPAMLWATLGMLVVCMDGLIRDVPDTASRVDGVLLLIGFVAFLVFTVRNAARRASYDPVIETTQQEVDRQPTARRAFSALLTLVGLGGVLLGSHWTVEGATRVAESIGISQAVIGLTVVAVGTSLPELTTSLFAALKGQADLAIGNVVGSNVFNLLFVFGVSATLRPVAIPAGGRLDLVVMAAFALVLLPLARSQRRLSRPEGILLFVAYASYLAWRATS